MKPIVTAPSNILSTPAKTVTAFDKRLTKLISLMTKTLLITKSPKGVGLAAPQIGQPWRVFLTRPTEKSSIRVFINPEIRKYSEEVTDGVPARSAMPARSDAASSGEQSVAGGPERDNKLEGCLSIPGVWGRVKRAQSVRLQFHDETGGQQVEEFNGFLASIIQHETDHTNGILYTKRVLEQKGKLYQSVKDKDGKETLNEIPL